MVIFSHKGVSAFGLRVCFSLFLFCLTEQQTQANMQYFDLLAQSLDQKSHKYLSFSHMPTTAPGTMVT
jgi:hypothetical protein